MSAETQAQFAYTQRAFAALLERFTPWLAEFGNWIFGGLIAFILVILAAFITIGPVDAAILVATLAFALALPLDLAGLVLLRVVADLKDVHLEDEMAQALRDAGFHVDDAGMPLATNAGARRRRRTRTALFFALGILALSALLTMTGVVAALWHVAWWVGVAFLAMSLISAGAVIVALFLLQPPPSPEERERQHHYWESLMRQVRASPGPSDQNSPSDQNRSNSQTDQNHEHRSGI